MTEPVRPNELRAFFAYISEEAIRDSLRRQFPFNVIQPLTGAKVDLVPLPRDVFTRMAFERRQRMEHDAEGHSAAFIRAEDLVVAKLVAFRETESDKHLRDARGILATQWGRLDLEAIRRQAAAAGVGEAFDRALAMARQEVEDE